MQPTGLLELERDLVGGAEPAPRAITNELVADASSVRPGEIEGRVTGDKVRTAQGKAGMAKGEVKGIAERAGAKVKAGLSRAKSTIQGGRAKASARTSRAR